MRLTTRRTTRGLAALAALALVLTACGGNGDDAATPEDTGEDTAAEETPAETDTATGTETGNGEGEEAEGELLAAAQEAGSITVGFANEIPYGFIDEETGEPSGEAVAVGTAVLAELGIDEIEADVVDFGALIGGLNAGQFDMIAAGMFINEERASQALFSDPDYCASQAFAVPEGNPAGLENYQSIADNPDVQLGVLSGAVEEGYATSIGVPEGQLSPFQSTADMVSALTSGRIDAFALTRPTVETQVEGLEGFEATEGFIPVIDGEEQLGCGGFVFRFENEAFRNAFNEILVQMRANDEILPLIEEFGFIQEEVDAAAETSVEDLIGMPCDFNQPDDLNQEPCTTAESITGGGGGEEDAGTEEETGDGEED